MSLDRLPNELICIIARACQTTSDIGALAAVNRHIHELVDPILYRINVDEQDGGAMFWAALTGRVNTMEKLYNAGAEVNDATGSYSVDPTQLLPPHVNLDIVRPFLQFTPLHLAAMMGHDGAVLWLIDRGARMNAPCRALCSCTKFPYDDRSRDAYHPPDFRLSPLWSPLHLAVCQGRKSTAKLLMECDGTGFVDGPVDTDFTVFHTVAQTNYWDLVSMLAEQRMVPVNQKTIEGGFTALHFAVRVYTEEEIQVLEEFLKLDDIDLELACDSGLAPLAYACIFGCLKAAIRLLEANADPHAPASGFTILQAVLRHFEWYFPDPHNLPIDADDWAEDQLALVDLLLQKGANPNGCDMAYVGPDEPFGPRTPPLIAAIREDLDVRVVRRLLRAGAIVDIRDHECRTPLWHAASKLFEHPHAEDVMVRLLEAGARLDVACGAHQTPLEVLLSRVGNLGDYTAVHRIVTRVQGDNLSRRSWLDRSLQQAIGDKRAEEEVSVYYQLSRTLQKWEEQRLRGEFLKLVGASSNAGTQTTGVTAKNSGDFVDNPVHVESDDEGASQSTQASSFAGRGTNAVVNPERHDPAVPWEPSQSEEDVAAEGGVAEAGEEEELLDGTSGSDFEDFDARSSIGED